MSNRLINWSLPSQSQTASAVGSTSWGPPSTPQPPVGKARALPDDGSMTLSFWSYPFTYHTPWPAPSGPATNDRKASPHRWVIVNPGTLKRVFRPDAASYFVTRRLLALPTPAQPPDVKYDEAAFPWSGVKVQAEPKPKVGVQARWVSMGRSSFPSLSCRRISLLP